MTQGKPRITVIVPAYNAEQYLERCLNSFANQTFTDFEVIVVNDGSADKTGQIADSFAAKDSRFRIIHQNNQGVAAARQVGLKYASGEFVIHADSDDWVDLDMLEVLYQTAKQEQADMVICDMLIIHPGNTIEHWVQKPDSLDSIQLMGEMLYDLHGSLCNKLIRLSRLREYDINFVPGMNCAEDLYMVLRLLSYHIKVAYIARAFYHYDRTQNESSIMNRGMSASERIKPIEMLAAYTDITPIQEYYDRALFHVAFEYLYSPTYLCQDYRAVFKKHISSFRRVKGFPSRTKLLVFLRLYGIRLPLNEIKRFWIKLSGHEGH